MIYVIHDSNGHCLGTQPSLQDAMILVDQLNSNNFMNDWTYTDVHPVTAEQIKDILAAQAITMKEHDEMQRVAEESWQAPDQWPDEDCTEDPKTLAEEEKEARAQYQDWLFSMTDGKGL